MPPYNSTGSLSTQDVLPRFMSSLNELKQQWSEPTDVFSILLLLGGEIVNKALAQLAGGYITPVTFSFGWVSYAVTTFLAGVGDVKLMPPATSEGSGLVVNARSGYTRPNTSWVIGRLLRDYEFWMDPAARTKLQTMLDERHRYMERQTKTGTKVPRPDQTGLCISIYEPSKTKTAGRPMYDLIFWSGFLVALAQLAIAAVPFAVASDWSIMMVTVCGILLALITGSLPQWKKEKWACRRGSQNTYALTQGNGSQHVIVVLGNGRGLNLEDLAIGGRPVPDPFTRACLIVVSTLWVSLLITAAGLTINTWYLLAVGGTGIFQNVLVVGSRRNASALGVHLEFREVIGAMTTMDALLALEEKYAKVGRSLLPIFFPGDLRPEEVVKWEMLKVKAERDEKRQRANTALAQLQGRPVESVVESWTAHAKTFET